MRSVNILGIKYEIEILTAKQLLAKFENNEEDLKDLLEITGPNAVGFAGLCLARSCKIYINSEMSKEKIKKVLLHEIVEAIQSESQIEIEHSDLQAITNGFWCAGIVSGLEIFVENDS